MEGTSTKRGKVGVAAVILLTIVGIALLGESGIVGLLVLALALGIAVMMVARA